MRLLAFVAALRGCAAREWSQLDHAPEHLRVMHAPVIALLVMLLVPCAVNAYGAGGAEDRCIELGSICKCSEPLNTNSYTAHGGGWWNPNDTSGGVTDCARNSATLFDNTITPVPVANLGSGEGHGDNLPAGADVDWVLSLNSNLAQMPFNNSASINVGSNNRWCARAYMMYDENTTWVEFTGSKIRNMHFGSGQSLSGIPGGASNPANHGWGYFDNHWPFVNGTAGCQSHGSAPIECFGTGTVTNVDMTGHWFRVEHCIYISGGNFWTEGYMQSVTGPAKSKTWTPKQFGAATSTVCGSLGCEGFRNVGQDTHPNYHLIVSLPMWAIWTTSSQGTFIGPADEIEGTGAPELVCTNNGPRTTTQTTSLLATPSGFTGTMAYTFDCNDNGSLGTCVAEGGSLGACDSTSCTCVCPAGLSGSPTGTTHTLDCSATATGPPEGPATDTTDVSIFTASAIAQNDGPIDEGEDFSITITPSNFTGTMTYLFDMIDDGTPSTCASHGAGYTQSGGCDFDSPCTCTATQEQLGDGTHNLDWSVSATSPAEGPVSGITVLSIQAVEDEGHIRGGKFTGGGLSWLWELWPDLDGA